MTLDDASLGDARAHLHAIPDSFEDLAYSTWSQASHGPAPRPDWVITDGEATDEDLGIIKTGKEADVHLVRRGLAHGPASLLAAKRYRSAQRRMFHRDAGYQEGRRVRRSRETRAMARRTEFGRELLSSRWPGAEFAALAELWSLGAPVPYPVQLLGNELMLEFIGEPDGSAAPRLAQLTPSRPELAELFEQCRVAMTMLAANGWAHGDLSAFNMLVHDDRLILIDLPQIVDIVANPQGQQYLLRDCINVCRWFRSRGLPLDPEELFADLIAEMVSRW
jgi:RIO kinase 1